MGVIAIVARALGTVFGFFLIESWATRTAVLARSRFVRVLHHGGLGVIELVAAVAVLPILLAPPGVLISEKLAGLRPLDFMPDGTLKWLIGVVLFDLCNYLLFAIRPLVGRPCSRTHESL